MNRDITIYKSVAESILGRTTYLDFLTYTLKAFQRCLDAKQECNDEYYLVGVTRRCYVMWWDIFAQIQENKQSSTEEVAIIDKIKSILLELCDMCPDGNFEEAFRTFIREHFITDTAFSSMVGYLLDEYNKTGHFPRFIILDELLIHGRGLNGLLFQIEQSLVSGCEQFLEKKGSGVLHEEQQSVQQAFLDSLDIWIYAENENEDLLLKRYAARMHSLILCTHSEWRALSLRFGQLVSVGKLSNVGFSWSIEHKEMPLQSDETGSFKLITTHLQNVEQKTYIWFYPNQASPRVAATIRFKRNAAGELLCVPYIIYGSLLWKNLSSIQKHISAIAEQQNKKSISAFLNQNNQYHIIGTEASYIRWVAETTDLILSSLLMKKFANEVVGASDWKSYESKYIKEIRYDSLLPNYRLHIQKDEKSMLDVADRAVKQIWEMDFSLEDLLAELTTGGKSFLKNDSSTENLWSKKLETVDLPIDSPIVFAVEDSIAHIGIQAERNAFDRFQSSSIFNDIDLTNWGKNYSLALVLDVFQDTLNRYKEDLKEKPSLYQFIAILTQAMDLGLLGMSTVPQDMDQNSPDSDTDMEVYTRQRAGEAALFILPIRYRFFLKDLDSIVKKYKNEHNLIEREVNDLVDSLPDKDEKEWQAHPHDSPEVMKQCLLHFIKILLSSGQTFEDWNITLNDTSSKYKRSIM